MRKVVRAEIGRPLLLYLGKMLSLRRYFSYVRFGIKYREVGFCDEKENLGFYTRRIIRIYNR